MSRTRKDFRNRQGTVIEVIKVGDDAFDLLVNHEVFRRNAPETALPEWLCVRYGFCGDEYYAILHQLRSLKARCAAEAS
jgi:hypothetical protein